MDARNILLGAFQYSEGTDVNYIYGILEYKPEEVYYEVKYLTNKELPEYYNKDPESFDFTLEEGLLYWRRTPSQVTATQANKSKGTSFNIGYRGVSPYQVINYLAANGFYYIDKQVQDIPAKLPTMPLLYTCKMSELNYPKNNLGIYANFAVKGGKSDSRALVSYGSDIEPFRVLGPVMELDSKYSQFFNSVKNVKIGLDEYMLYEISGLGTSSPLIETLGTYLSNFVCYLTTLSERYRASVDGLSYAAHLFTKLGKLGTFVRGEDITVDNDDSVKIFTNSSYDEESMLSCVEHYVRLYTELDKSNNIFLDSPISESELEETEGYVIRNLVAAVGLDKSSNIVRVHTITEMINKLNIKRTEIELMLFVQRYSLTLTKPSRVKLLKEGVSGITRYKTVGGI